MVMGTERSKPLHNFTMPSGLRWGNQRFLRCMKVNSDGEVSPIQSVTNNDSDSSDRHRRRQHSIQQRRTAKNRESDGDSSSAEFIVNRSDKIGSNPASASNSGKGLIIEEEDEGIAAVREKVMFDLQSAADKMKDAIFKEGIEKGEVSVSPSSPPPVTTSAAEGVTSRPWNLRTRRASIKMPLSSGGGGGGSAGVNGGFGDGKSLRVGAAPASIDKSSRLRSGGSGAGEKRDRAKFSVALSKREIEEDFLSMAGHRPQGRPKKRTKTLQKQLDAFSPGLWLTEVTPDMYKVHEPAP